MPSTRENKLFYAMVMPGDGDFLESCLDWIRDNLEPEDVFSSTSLESWAENKGYKMGD